MRNKKLGKIKNSAENYEEIIKGVDFNAKNRAILMV